MKKLTVISMTLVAMIFAVSCRGPQGPEGPTGNANVASSTLTVYPSQWYWDNTSWRVDIEYKAINADIDAHGAVLVYMDVEGTWRQIPMTYYYYDAQYDSFYASSLEVSTYLEGLSIFWTESDLSQLDAPGTHDFKIVVIAASVYQSRSDVDYSNYEAVKKAFQLADD
jgi:hypothetical protein